MFRAPIPGQSLTSEPKNAAWERPPEMTDPEEALVWHMDRLEKPQKVKAITTLLDLGLDVVTLTEGILRGAVADGRHTVDVSLVIAPIIHEYIVGVGKSAGIDFKEGIPEDPMESEDFKYAIQNAKAKKILNQLKGHKPVDLTPLEQDVAAQGDQTEMPMVSQEEMTQEQPSGFMQRRGA